MKQLTNEEVRQNKAIESFILPRCFCRVDNCCLQWLGTPYVTTLTLSPRCKKDNAPYLLVKFPFYTFVVKSTDMYQYGAICVRSSHVWRKIFVYSCLINFNPWTTSYLGGDCGGGVMERWDTKSFIVGSEWETMRPFHRCGPLSCQMCHAAILLSTRSLPVSPWTSASMSPVSHISHRCLCYILSSIFWPEFLSPTPPKILK